MDLRLYQLTGLEHEKIADEHQGLVEKIKHYTAVLGDDSKFVFSKDEYAELAKADEAAQLAVHEETLASIPEAERTAEMDVFEAKGLPAMELYVPEVFEKLRDNLHKYGCKMASYFVADGELFEIIDEDEVKTHIFTLKELISFLRENGRKGLEIQRYKGLGEMNADQLWETTMDPEKRTLIQVTIPDTIAADHMFTMLMGEEVPPRRAFIEQHALSVKNLDV